MKTHETFQKGDVIRHLLEVEGRLMLCLDASCSGVDVPSRLKRDRSLMLILNRKMPHPIDIGEEAVCSELRFGGVPHFCTVPYDAIWSVFNPDTNHGMMWPESMPAEVLSQYGQTPIQDLTFPPPQGKLPPVPPEGKTSPSHKPSPFHVIEGGGTHTNPPAGKPTKRPKLTVVE